SGARDQRQELGQGEKLERREQDDPPAASQRPGAHPRSGLCGGLATRRVVRRVEPWAGSVGGGVICAGRAPYGGMCTLSTRACDPAWGGAPHPRVGRPSATAVRARRRIGRGAASAAADQAFGAGIDRASRASSSWVSVSSPRSTKPSATTASRTEIRSATACLAIFAADS